MTHTQMPRPLKRTLPLTEPELRKLRQWAEEPPVGMDAGWLNAMANAGHADPSAQALIDAAIARRDGAGR